MSNLTLSHYIQAKYEGYPEVLKLYLEFADKHQDWFKYALIEGVALFVPNLIAKAKGLEDKDYAYNCIAGSDKILLGSCEKNNTLSTAYQTIAKMPGVKEVYRSNALKGKGVGFYVEGEFLRKVKAQIPELGKFVSRLHVVDWDLAYAYASQGYSDVAAEVRQLGSQSVSLGVQRDLAEMNRDQVPLSEYDSAIAVIPYDDPIIKLRMTQIQQEQIQLRQAQQINHLGGIVSSHEDRILTLEEHRQQLREKQAELEMSIEALTKQVKELERSASLNVVYFVYFERSKLIKIGTTQSNRLSKRIKELERANRLGIGKTLLIIKGGIETEEVLHRAFRHREVIREMFQPCDEIFEYIRQNGGTTDLTSEQTSLTLEFGDGFAS